MTGCIGHTDYLGRECGNVLGMQHGSHLVLESHFFSAYSRGKLLVPAADSH